MQLLLLKRKKQKPVFLLLFYSILMSLIRHTYIMDSSEPFSTADLGLCGSKRQLGPCLSRIGINQKFSQGYLNPFCIVTAARQTHTSSSEFLIHRFKYFFQSFLLLLRILISPFLFTAFREQDVTSFGICLNRSELHESTCNCIGVKTCADLKCN